MKLSIADNEKNSLLEELKTANLNFKKYIPAISPTGRLCTQCMAVQIFFKCDTCIKMGDIALRNLKTYAPDFVTLANVLKFKGHEHLARFRKENKKAYKEAG